MPRKLRLEYRGAIYHAMNRGDRREAIFGDDEDRKVFPATLGEACQKTRWQVHAFCLMRNHFHLVVETPEAAGGRAGKNRYGGERFEIGEERAGGMVEEELKRLGWAEGELARRRKGDPQKVALAGRLRAETTMSLAWIAERLQMGSWSYVSNLLRKAKSVKSED